MAKNTLNTIEQEFAPASFVVGDTVRMVDTCYCPIKNGARGKIVVVNPIAQFGENKGNSVEGMVIVEFNLHGEKIQLTTGIGRFRFVRHGKLEDALPDAADVVDEEEAE